MIDVFTDPILRAPLWGTLFMSISSSLIGVVLFLKKKTLLSESLSHATYPGVVFALTILGLFFPSFEAFSLIAIFIGAFIFAFLAYKMIHFLQEKQKVSADASLCFVLALFFGMGVVATSVMQALIPSWTGQVQMVLFGQAATMLDMHIFFYGAISLAIVIFFYAAFYLLQSTLFDPAFSKSIGLKTDFVEKVFGLLFILALILGMRCVGVVLMSAMVIAPAVSARQFTDHLHKMFFLSAFFGAMSAFIGNILAISSKTVHLPTGPTIVLVGSFIALFSLMFAPKRGWVFRKLRIGTYHFRCLQENALKALWKNQPMMKEELQRKLSTSSIILQILLQRLSQNGWIFRQGKEYFLTQDGKNKASQIVRLHRLFELYLTDILNIHAEKVHQTAEEMEHILTPDIEERLTKLLSNPKVDPHLQPIPGKMEGL